MLVAITLVIIAAIAAVEPIVSIDAPALARTASK